MTKDKVEELKEKLTRKGYVFYSETDTEVAVKLIDYYYKKYEGTPIDAINHAMVRIRGSYALAVMFKDYPEEIYVARKDSPMILGVENGESFIASDVPAILKYTRNYYLLEYGEIATIKSDRIEFCDFHKQNIKKEIQVSELDMDAAEKGGYEHFMLKEINEQDKVFKDTINYYYDGSMESLEKNFGFIKKFKKIDIVACGSAYHTGIVGKSLIEKYADVPVNVEVASEYRYKKCFYDKDTLLIVVSQSGETADTLAALRKAKNDGITTMAIVNVIGSSIAREADHVVYIKAGFEIAVATTKAYLAQVAIFSLIALYLGKAKNIISDEEYKKISDEIKEMPKLIQKTIKNDNYIEIADKIYNKKQIFFIGRAIDYAIALEASLKLKEISYINSVAYQAGELKHGTISLIAKNTPVIALLTDEEIAEKTISNIKETKARGAYVILVTNMIPNEKFYDKIITIDKIEEILQPILTIIPLQLLSYRIAKNKGCDIDKPRNLAKSVGLGIDVSVLEYSFVFR